MSLDFLEFDAFCGVLWALSDAVDTAAQQTGVPRELLTAVLCSAASRRKDTREVNFWRNARSREELNKWMWKETGRKFDASDERKMSELAHEIPVLIRKNLMQIAKSIPAPKGGNPRSLDILQSFAARHQVRSLRKKGLSKAKAYEKVAKRMKVSAHTVRRECEPEERARSMRPSGPGVAFLSMDSE